MAPGRQRRPHSTGRAMPPRIMRACLTGATTARIGHSQAGQPINLCNRCGSQITRTALLRNLPLALGYAVRWQGYQQLHQPRSSSHSPWCIRVAGSLVQDGISPHFSKSGWPSPVSAWCEAGRPRSFRRFGDHGDRRAAGGRRPWWLMPGFGIGRWRWRNWATWHL